MGGTIVPITQVPNPNCYLYKTNYTLFSTLHYLLCNTHSNIVITHDNTQFSGLLPNLNHNATFPLDLINCFYTQSILCLPYLECIETRLLTVTIYVLYCLLFRAIPVHYCEIMRIILSAFQELFLMFYILNFCAIDNPKGFYNNGMDCIKYNIAST